MSPLHGVGSRWADSTHPLPTGVCDSKAGEAADCLQSRSKMAIRAKCRKRWPNGRRIAYSTLRSGCEAGNLARLVREGIPGKKKEVRNDDCFHCGCADGLAGACQPLCVPPAESAIPRDTARQPFLVAYTDPVDASFVQIRFPTPGASPVPRLFDSGMSTAREVMPCIFSNRPRPHAIAGRDTLILEIGNETDTT